MVKRSTEISAAPLGTRSVGHHGWGPGGTALRQGLWAQLQPHEGVLSRACRRAGCWDRKHALLQERVPETPSGQVLVRG